MQKKREAEENNAEQVRENLVHQLTLLKQVLHEDSNLKKYVESTKTVIRLTRPDKYKTITEKTLNEAKRQIKEISGLFDSLEAAMNQPEVACFRVVRLGGRLAEKIDQWQEFVTELNKREWKYGPQRSASEILAKRNGGGSEGSGKKMVACGDSPADVTLRGINFGSGMNIVLGQVWVIDELAKALREARVSNGFLSKIFSSGEIIISQSDMQQKTKLDLGSAVIKQFKQQADKEFAEERHKIEKIFPKSDPLYAKPALVLRPGSAALPGMFPASHVETAKPDSSCGPRISGPGVEKSGVALKESHSGSSDPQVSVSLDASPSLLV